MSDDNERSVASAGSVASEPVAWAALSDDGDIAWIGYTPDGAADGACGRPIIPLYRFTLTDAEREAVEAAARIIDAYEDEMDGFSSGAAATLRGLLERMK